MPIKHFKINYYFYFTSRKYKFEEKEGAYFISFATVYPVETGFVTDAVDWKYSSARNYANNDHTVLEIDLN